MHPQASMRVKRNFFGTALLMVFLVISVILTPSDWITCEDLLPDEYMDMTGKAQQDAQQTIFHTVDLVNAILFVWLPEDALRNFLPLAFAKVSLFLRRPFPVILRI
jgi:hypothetical protein